MALTEAQEQARQAAMLAAAARPAPPEPRVLEFRITPELAAAMAAFQSDLPKIERDRRVDVETAEGKDDYGYDYATLEHVTERVFPKLTAQGLAFISTPTLGMDGKPVLRYFLTHSSGGYIAAEFPVRGEKMQQIGSAITYLRRYCLQAATGVAAPGADDDGTAADADSGPRTAARRARGEQAARNTAARRETGTAPATARRREPVDRPTSGPPADGPAERKEFSPPRNPDAPISNPQAQRLAILFGELGIHQKEARIQITGMLAGRTIGSSKELTMGEAHEIMGMIDGAIAASNGDTQKAIQILRETAADIAARMAAAAESPPPLDDQRPLTESEWSAEIDAAKRDRATE